MIASDASGSELPYLQAFHAVCTERGFTAAARRLRCTQPAVSYQIRALERVLRARLIERGGRRLVLTPAGERLRDFCHQFFDELEGVRRMCSSGQPVAPLRLGSASGFGRYVLFPALLALREAEPDAAAGLWLQFDSADVVLRGLERAEYEAAFVYTHRISNLLRFRAVYDEELVLISAPSLTRQLDPALETIEGFEQAPFVTYQEGDYVFGRWFEGNFGEQPGSLTSVAHFSELEEVIELVRLGAGISIVPRDSIQGMPGAADVEILYRGRGAPCINQVYMVTRSGSVARPELELLAALLPGRYRGVRRL